MAHYYNQLPQPNFNRVITPLSASARSRVSAVSAKRLSLHIAFIVVAFSAALMGGHLFSTPAAGMALTAESLTELPMVVAMVGNALFLMVWAWLVMRVGNGLGLFGGRAPLRA